MGIVELGVRGSSAGTTSAKKGSEVIPGTPADAAVAPVAVAIADVIVPIAQFSKCDEDDRTRNWHGQVPIVRFRKESKECAWSTRHIPNSTTETKLERG